MSIGHFFAYLSAISLLASTKKRNRKKKIVKNDHVLKTLSTLFSVFSFYRFDEKNRFSPTFGGLQFVNKILISFLRDKKRK